MDSTDNVATVAFDAGLWLFLFVVVRFPAFFLNCCRALVMALFLYRRLVGSLFVGPGFRVRLSSGFSFGFGLFYFRRLRGGRHLGLDQRPLALQHGGNGGRLYLPLGPGGLQAEEKQAGGGQSDIFFHSDNQNPP
jgi:hypothetical protein